MGYILPRIREGVFLDIFFSTASWEELLEERSEDVMEEIRGKSVKDLDPQEHHAKNYLSKRFTGMEYNYQVAISILANEPEKSNVKNLANGIEEVMNRQGKIKFWRHRRWDPLQRFNPSKTLNPMPLPLPNAHMTLVDTELACLLHLPPGNERIYQKPKTEESKDRGTVLHLKKGQRLPKKEDFTEGAAGLGKVWYPLATERFIYIANHVLKKHMAIFGRTGSGKSSFALMIIKSIIKKWAEGKPGGFLAFDPKADTVFQILTYLVALDKELKKSGSGLKWEKIHFFDLGSDKYPVGMNMLHRYDGETDNDVALRAEEILKSASNSDAHTLLETYGRPALRLLTADKEPHSILELDAVLAKNPAYRKTLKKKLAPKLNPRLRRKWKEIEKDVSKGFETKSLRNRLEKFAEDDVLKRIFGQKKMSLDLRESMDDSHIVLFKANRLNDEQLRIIGGYVASQLYTVAKQRKKDAVLFPVLFEEFQLYQVPAMKKLLSLSRDKGVPMIGLTQFPDQLESWLYDAIFENVGTIISCALGEKSAERVAGLTGKGKEDEGFSAKDLIALGKEGSRIGAVMTENENEQREFMYLQADPPYMYGPDGKPIYWGTDTERHSREKEAAKVAAQKFAEKHLASRDCLTAEEIDRDIDQFYIDLETLERTHDLKQKSTQDDDFDDLGGDEDSWWLEDDNDAV